MHMTQHFIANLTAQEQGTCQLCSSAAGRCVAALVFAASGEVRDFLAPKKLQTGILLSHASNRVRNKKNL